MNISAINCGLQPVIQPQGFRIPVPEGNKYCSTHENHTDKYHQDIVDAAIDSMQHSITIATGKAIMGALKAAQDLQA